MPEFIKVDGIRVPWFCLYVEYQDLVEQHRLLQSTSIDPVPEHRVRQTSDFTVVGTAALLAKFFRKFKTGVRPRVLIIAVGKGADLRRVFYAAHSCGRELESVDTVDISSSFATNVDNYRRTTRYPGRSVYCDVLSEHSPLRDGRYDLILCHQALQNIASTHARLQEFLQAISASLSPGGAFIGTYPDASSAIAYDHQPGFTAVMRYPPTDQNEWGSWKVSLDEVLWDDPVIPMEELAYAADLAMLSMSNWNAMELGIVLAEYIPNKLYSFRDFPVIGYFRCFEMTRAPETAPVGPPVKTAPWSARYLSDIPMDLEATEWGINYGVPATINDAPWILVAEHYVKDKANGYSGLLVSMGGRVYLKINNGKQWMILDNVNPTAPFALQVEIVGEVNGLTTPRMILSDPLYFGEDFRGKTFATRLTRFEALRPSCKALSLVDPGVWVVATPQSVQAAWELAEEGIILQPFCALSVTYKNGADQRGSMRAIKKVVTVDLDSGMSGTRKIGGHMVELKAEHGPGVGEYAVTAQGLSFVRMRPDKKQGNSEIQLKRLSELLTIDVVQDLLAKRVRAPCYAMVEFKPDLFDKPGFLALLVALIGVNIVASTRLLKDTLRLKSLQGVLVAQLATNQLPVAVKEVLSNFGYCEDVILRPIELPDLVKPTPAQNFELLLEEYLSDVEPVGPFLVSPYEDEMLMRVNAMSNRS